MSDFFNNFIFQILSIGGSLCSILSIFSFKKRINNNKKDEQSIVSVWPIILIFLINIIFLVLFIIGFIFNWKQVYWFLLCFIVALISLLIYANEAKKSFEKSTILPPQKLWESIFNKIPSQLKNVNQRQFRFLIVKMENDSGENNDTPVNNIVEKILNNYNNKETDFLVEILFVNIPKIDIKSKEDLKNNKSVKKKFDNINNKIDDCHGVIFIVGEKCYKVQQRVLRVMDFYSEYTNLPIAYIRVGNHHYKLDSKYYRISESEAHEGVNHLIMRGFLRSDKWVKLSRRNHKFMIICACLFLASLSAFIFSQKELYKIDPIHLEDEFHIDFPDSIDIEKLKNNKIFSSFFKDVNKYFFSEIPIKNFKIWIKEKGTSIVKNVFENNDNHNNTEKNINSIIGGIANNNNMFFLWPGVTNDDPFWDDNCLAWQNIGGTPYYISSLNKDEKNLNVSVTIQKTENDKVDTIHWAFNDNRTDDNQIAIYGVTFNQRIIVELDFDIKDINTMDVRDYIYKKDFRNQVRRYADIISAIIRALEVDITIKDNNN